MNDTNFFDGLYSATGVAPWIVIVGMAIVTAATRYVGYWALGGRQLTTRTKHILSAVPVSVLTAIVAPMVLATGIPESVAAMVTILLAWRFPTIIAIAGGVASVVLLRFFI